MKVQSSLCAATKTPSQIFNIAINFQQTAISTKHLSDAAQTQHSINEAPRSPWQTFLVKVSILPNPQPVPFFIQSNRKDKHHVG